MLLCADEYGAHGRGGQREAGEAIQQGGQAQQAANTGTGRERGEVTICKVSSAEKLGGAYRLVPKQTKGLAEGRGQLTGKWAGAWVQAQGT